MVTKIGVGNSLCGAPTYNGGKTNEEERRFLMANHTYNDGMETVDTRQAMEDFLALMSVRSRVEKPVVHISLNPHPGDILTDTELQDIAREYLEKMGSGNQPYTAYKHGDMDRHYLYIVMVRADGGGRSIDTRNNLYCNKQATRELERKYRLYNAGRKSRRIDIPLHKVDVLAGGTKKQAGNTVKELNHRYRFQTMGEYRTLLPLYNMTVEEAWGSMRGREYDGLIYSVMDDSGNKVGNPFKSSLFGGSVGYDAVQKEFARLKMEIKDRKPTGMMKHTVPFILQSTYDKERFTATFKEKGIDTVLRCTEEGRIYGATLINYRTGCVLSGSCMGRGLSANVSQEHFTLSHTGQPPAPFFITTKGQEETQAPPTPEYERDLDCTGLFSPEGPAVDVEEETLIRATQRRKKKEKHKGLRM